jgi:CMP-N-acetylneuraminic acid synthetase
MSIVAVIPARGGSKRVPGKNLRECAGRPLLEWTCIAARAARRVDRTILSTDDAAIAEAGRAAGVEVPFLRPAHLSTDAVPMLPVLVHLLDWIEASQSVEALVLLQPTSPLRIAADIDGAVDLLRDENADSVVTVTAPINAGLPSKLMMLGGDGLALSPIAVPVPDESRLVVRNGPAVLVVRPATLRAGMLYGPRTLGYRMPVERSLDIDTPFEFRLAELLLSDRGAR